MITATSQDSRPKLYVLDYGAGNVRSLANSIEKLGYEFEWIKTVDDFDKAEVRMLAYARGPGDVCRLSIAACA